MDEALRRLERGDDPVAHAAALRRAGDEVRARRAVEAAVRAGHRGARATLDAWWPLEARVDAVVAAALGDVNHWRWSNVRAALAWLLGDEDPRVDDSLARLTTALLEQTGVPVDSAGWRDDERLIAVARGDAEARRRAVVEQAGDGLPLTCLARGRLDAGEVERLLDRVTSGEHDPSTRRLLLASTLWHAGASGRADLVRSFVEDVEPVIAAEVTRWLERPPASWSPALLPGRPLRPAWCPAGCPAETRDALTGAFTRAAFTGDLAAPLVSDAPREAPMTDWLLDVDVVGMRRVNDVHGLPTGDDVLVELTRRLQRSLGDRVARWGGERWLVRLEPDLDPRSVAEALLGVASASPVARSEHGPVRATLSIGIGRGVTWREAIVRAEAAVNVARDEGGDRVREAL